MSDSDERMLEWDSPEVITKAGNTIKKIKTHKKDPGRQNRKRPAEAAGSFTQVAHGGGNAINYNATQPFRAKNSKANDKWYKCGGHGPWAREWRKTYNGNKFGVGRGLVQKDKQRLFFLSRQCRKVRYFLRTRVRYILY